MVEREYRVADAFSAAAPQYDFHARLQKGVATTLADWLAADCQGVALDLGCGTGPTARLLQARAPQVIWLGVDRAAGMLQELVARGRSGDAYFPVQASATALPFADGSVSCVYSSFSLQWVSDRAALVAELHRVLSAKGEVLLALPLSGSLEELDNSYRQAGLQSPVNNLGPAEDWSQLFVRAGFLEQQEVVQQKFVEYYANFSAVHRMIKGTGAHVRLDESGHDIRKQDYTALRQAYERHRVAEGLPVSWQVGFWRWQK